MNTSSVVFEKEEEDLLCRGLKYCFRPFDSNATKCRLTADLAVQIGPSMNVQEEVAGAINEMVFPTMTHLDQRNVKSLHTRIEENRLIVSKADKGNAVVTVLAVYCIFND